MLVNSTVVTRLKRNLFDQLTNKLRNIQLQSRTVCVLEPSATNPGFLACDLYSSLQLRRIVGHDFGADAVLERRDDLSSRSVVFRVRRKNEHHVKRQTHWITLNLHVAFLHYVEEADLNLAGEIRQFVNSEDTAVGAGQQTIVNRQLIAQEVPALSSFNRIDVADDVGDRHVRRRKFLHKTRITTNPVDVS